MFSRREETRWARRWLDGPVERLSGERRRELIEAAAARGRMSSRGALVRLRENLWPVVQTATATALALTHELDRGRGLAARGDRRPGDGGGDLTGSRTPAAQRGRGVGDPGGDGSAGTRGFPPTRLLDVLVGGTVALVFSQVLFPVHPVKLVRGAAESMVGELADTLRAVAHAIEERDPDTAQVVLGQARRISAGWGRFEQALGMGGEAARFAPARRRHRGPLGVYRDIGHPLDLIVSDVGVLARTTVRALRLDDSIPPALPAALHELANATDALAVRIGAVEDHPEVSSPALRAVSAATALDSTGQGPWLGVLVAYTQATAADLLRALGTDRDPADDRVGQVAAVAAASIPGNVQEPSRISARGR